MAIITNCNLQRPMATNFDPYIFENYFMKDKVYPTQLELFDKLDDSFRYTADDLKIAIMKKYRYDKQFEMSATEVEFCDIIITNHDKTPIIEVETKVSWQDFLADFKKPKHHNYSILKGNCIPDYFYFGVPETLHSRCLEYLNKCQYKHYGLIVYDKKWNDVFTVKPAKKININESQRDLFFKLICKRCCSQLVTLYEQKIKLLEEIKLLEGKESK